MFEEYSEKNHSELPPLTIIQGGGTIRRDESDRALQYDRDSLSNYKMVNKDDFIVHLRSFEGGLEKANTTGIISPAYHTFSGENTDTTFYYTYFRSKKFIETDLKPHVYGIRDGRSIDIEGMKSINIPYTIFEEQSRIGKFIDLIDHLITLHQSKSFGHILKIIAGYTLYWEQRKLVSLCEKFTDGDWIEAKDQSHSGVRLIQTGNVGLGEYIDRPNNKKWISEETFVLLNCEEVLAGDILISRLPEPAGRACVVPKLGTKMVAAVDCTIARASTQINPKYLLQFLSSQSYFDEVNTCLAGGTRQRISRRNLADFDIPIPAKYQEQKAIGEFLFCIDHLITLHQLEPFKLIFKAIAYRIIDYAKSEPPRYKKYTDLN